MSNSLAHRNQHHDHEDCDIETCSVTNELQSDFLREAQHFHWNVFRKTASKQLCTRYAACMDQNGVGTGLRTLLDINRIVERKLDAEAIEAYSRLLLGKNNLTSKLQVLLYLAEIEPTHFEYFSRCTKGRFIAIAELLLAAMRSGFKLSKGLYLVKRHKLVIRIWV